MCSSVRIYHGTSKQSADDIVGPPPGLDVSRGEGEFGQGFYCGKSKGLAASLAAVRYDTPVLVLVSLSKAMRNQMKVKELNHAESNALRAAIPTRKRSTFHYNRDLIIGTIANRPRDLQYKFESLHAQSLLCSCGDLQQERL